MAVIMSGMADLKLSCRTDGQLSSEAPARAAGLLINAELPNVNWSFRHSSFQHH
jgi:hypothetical protein